VRKASRRRWDPCEAGDLKIPFVLGALPETRHASKQQGIWALAAAACRIKARVPGRSVACGSLSSPSKQAHTSFTIMGNPHKALLGVGTGGLQRGFVRQRLFRFFPRLDRSAPRRPITTCGMSSVARRVRGYTSKVSFRGSIVRRSIAR